MTFLSSLKKTMMHIKLGTNAITLIGILAKNKVSTVHVEVNLVKIDSQSKAVTVLFEFIEL